MSNLEFSALAKRHCLFSLLVLVIGLAGCSKRTEATASRSFVETLDQGLAAHAAGQLDKAESLYEDVLRQDKNNKYALYNLGAIAHSRGDASTAEKYYRTTLDIDHDFTEALFNLAILRTLAGDSGEGVALYRKVIKLKPDNAEAHLNLGFALQGRGSLDEATAELTRAIQLDSALVTRLGPPDDLVVGAGDVQPAGGSVSIDRRHQ